METSHDLADAKSHPLHPPHSPLVTQVGFAGSRMLYERKKHPDLDEAAFNRDVEDHLFETLGKIPKALGLGESHFLCAISSGAVGADTRFIEACTRKGIAQRIFLPENRDSFLSATSPKGERDFTEVEEAHARKVLDRPHIIEERVVTNSGDREQRFEDVNLEIVRVCSVLIAIAREGAQARRGGTKDLIERAKARKKLVLEITVSVRDGRAAFTEKWHPAPPDVTPQSPGTVPLHVPGVPQVVEDFQHQDLATYVVALKKFTGIRAGRHQFFFKTAAFGIIVTHVAATFLATRNLAFLQGEHPAKTVLIIEILLLLTGLGTHLILHWAGVVERWATARLLCEVARSVAAVSGVRRYLQHLFVLPLPLTIRHILRTLNVAHLISTRNLPSEHWKDRLQKYVTDRLDVKERGGQIPYYTEQRNRAWYWLLAAQVAFYAGSGSAILVTALELQETFHHASSTGHLGFAAVVLPVIAVAALSLAASFDLEARVHSYGEMVAALTELRDHLLASNSEGEFHSLVIQTEARLVGENAAWYSRRVFISVT